MPRSLARSARRIAAVLVTSALLALALPSSPAHAAAKPRFQSRHTPQGKTFLKSSHVTSLRTRAATASLVADPAAGPARSTWQVAYTGFTPQAQTAFQAAVDIWSRLVSSSVTIKVDATFANLGAGVLGSAGAHNNYKGAGIGDGASYYPNALADSLLGYDLNNETDIDASFSSTYSFYFGTDGLTPAGQIDFESVVLHELGHGLGFAGFMDYSGGQGSFPAQGRFDAFSYDALTGGNRLTSYANPSAALGTVLTGGSVYWAGTAGVASNGGVRPKLYVPATWADGSSYSHLDESTYPANNANSLMTYAIGNGESVHSPGPLVIGMLNDMGYRAYVAGAVVTPDAPTSVTAVAGNGQATVSWTAGSDNGSTLTGSTITSSPGGKTGTVVGTGTSGTVTGLTNGTAYTFTVKQTNSIGTSPASSASSAVTPATQASAPNAPTGVTASRTAAVGGSATVSWTASTTNGSALTGYTVTPSPSGTPVSVGAGVTSTAVSGLTNGSAYTFTVTAASAAGTSPSSLASSSVTPGTVPAAPTAVAATAGKNAAPVAFTPGSNNGYAVSSYTATASPGGLTGSGSSSPVTVSGLTNGTAYTFTVTATNSLGTGSASSASSAVTPADVPGQIASVSATPGDQSASLTWTAPATNGAPIVDYTVTTSPGGAIKTVTSASADVTGLTNGTSYSFTVTARNSVGSSLSSPASSAVTPSGLPGQVTAVVATQSGDGSVALTWTGAGGNGSALTDHEVTVTPGGATVLTGSGASAATVSGLANATSYTFTVRAKNANGYGTASAASNVVTLAAVPSTVSALTAVAGDQSATLSWAAPADNGTAIIDYTVTTSPGGATTTVATPGTTVSGLTNGTSYTFTVTARNGAGSSAASPASNAVTPSGTPDQVLGVGAVRAGDGTLLITWSAPSSNGAPITSYVITGLPGGPVQTDDATTNYLASGLTNGTAYSFSVQAVNDNGAGPGSSSSSPLAPAIAPGQVTGVTALAGKTSATVSWVVPADNGAPISGYVVTPSAGTPVSVGAVTSTVVNGLANGVAVTFTVHAVNAVGPGVESPASAPVKADSASPVLSITTPPAFALGTTAPVSFNATDGGSGVASFLVRTRRASANGKLGAYGATIVTAAHSYAAAAPRGQTTCTSIAARDKVGNTTAWSLDRCTTIPFDDRSLSATSGFRRLTSSAAYASTYTGAVRTGQYVRLASATGRRVVLVVTTCKTCGSVKVQFGGTVKTLSLVSSTTKWRAMMVLDFGTARTAAVTVTTTSARTVNIDGLGVSG